MNDSLPTSEPDHGPAPARQLASRWIALSAYSLALVLVAVMVTLAVGRPGAPAPGGPEPGALDSSAPGRGQLNTMTIAFGDRDAVVAEVTVPAGTNRSTLLHYNVTIEGAPTSEARAAMVAFHVECRSDDQAVEMQADGQVTTNVFLARGGSIYGQALAPETAQELQCTLLASAPHIERTIDGLTSLPLRTNLQMESADGTHHLALHWLEDATLIRNGRNVNVLSLRIDDPATLEMMNTTVRLTSCTVVGGSADYGENKCQESMTGRESSTVRVRVIARWLDAQGDISSTSIYWDETLAVDYNTHHLPWTLRQANLTTKVPSDAAAAVLLVQVESLTGTPAVVHADGTDSVITTYP